jgi:uncharacterized protein YkwD
MGAAAGQARLGIAALAALAAILVAGQGTASAEGCLYQDEAASSSNQTRVERSLLCMANAVRSRSGLDLLIADPRLDAAARGHSTDMVARGYFSHTGLDGSSPSDRAQAAGYPGGAGENIAASSRGGALTVFGLWRASAGHNANLLGSYTTTGLGVAPGFPGGRGGITATQMFGRGSAQGHDTGLDLYYPTERCRSIKQRKAALKARLRAVRKGRRAKLRRKLRRVRRAAGAACGAPAEAPLL